MVLFVSVFSTLTRKKKASQKILALFLTFGISSFVAFGLTAGVVVSQDTNSSSELIESRDSPKARNIDDSALQRQPTGIIITVLFSSLHQYAIRMSGVISNTGFSPLILPIRGSP